MLAIYRFARFADDLADEGDATPAARLADARRATAASSTAALAGEPANAMLAALAETVRRHRLPLGAVPRPAVGVPRRTSRRCAILPTRRSSTIARRSANPIGRLLLHLYDAATPANLAHSDAICTALQLVNFWQDIAIDWRKGRVYLPQRGSRTASA